MEQEGGTLECVWVYIMCAAAFLLLRISVIALIFYCILHLLSHRVSLHLNFLSLSPFPPPSLSPSSLLPPSLSLSPSLPLSLSPSSLSLPLSLPLPLSPSLPPSLPPSLSLSLSLPLSLPPSLPNSGFTSVVLSTLERRYGLSSTATGAIASTFDAAVLVSVVFISYFGGRGHKPRWLGASLIVQATGSFIFSLPQFVFGRYRVGSSGALSTEACLDGQDFTDCTSSTYGALFFFVLGNIFIGVGAAPLFTVGTTYLDEIVRPKHVSLHLGLFYMTSIVGPALGYALGGPFLSIYVDPWEDTHLTPSDPGWVGAWWLSFIFCGVVSLIISVPFFCYPRLSPSSRAIREEREREMAKKTEKPPRVSEGGNKIQNAAVSFLWDLRRIVINPSWIFMTVAICSSILVVSGFASFGPKYVETQFGIPPSVASLAVGAVGKSIVLISKSTHSTAYTPLKTLFIENVYIGRKSCNIRTFLSVLGLQV